MQTPDAGAANTPLMRCPEFEQRLLRLESGHEERCDDNRDEVLYVLEGRGRVTIGGETGELATGAGVFVARGTPWSVDDADDLLVLSVLVEEPLATDTTHAVIGTGERGLATAGRAFDLFACPDNGCASVTQFVGHIPPGRAPDHYHHLRRGRLHPRRRGRLPRRRTRARRSAPARASTFRRGSSTRSRTSAPARCTCSASSRPAGSPAEAYYPDGTAAAVAGGGANAAHRAHRERSAGKGTSRAARGRSTRLPAPSRRCRSRCRPASAIPTGRRAPRSFSPRRTAAASRCHSRAS